MRIRFLLPLIGLFGTASAQEVLTLDKALELALQQNNLLQVSRLQQNLAANNRSLGNAGFLPTVNVNAGNNFANNQLRQRIYSPALGTTTDITRSGVRQSNWNASAGFNWVLFNGLRRIHFYDRLKLSYERASAQTKADMENMVSDVSQTYFEIVRQLEITGAYQNNLILYQERLRLAEARYTNGLVSKSDVLITRADINSQKSLLITQQTNVENARIALNTLLNRPAETPFTVELALKKPVTDTLLIYTGTTTSLIATQKDVAIAEKQYKELRSAYLPTLSLLAGYTFTRVQSEAGQLQLNQNTGPNLGFTFGWSIFDGFNKNRLTTAGLLNVDAAKVLHQQNVLEQSAAFRRTLVQYKNALKILQLETESYAFAKESNDIAHERYKSGNISLFEYKETQRVLEDSNVRLANARYNSLLAEVELKRLNGSVL